MTKKERRIVSAYTGIMMVDIDDYLKFVSNLVGRRIYTPDLFSKHICEEIKTKVEPSFIALCNNKPISSRKA